MAQQNPLFEQLHGIVSKSKEINTTVKPQSVYMANRFLSLHADCFWSVYDCNALINLPQWAALPLLKYTTPYKTRLPFTAYPKKAVGKKLTPKQQKALQRTCNTFHVNKEHGMQILHLLTKQGINMDW